MTRPLSATDSANDTVSALFNSVEAMMAATTTASPAPLYANGVAGAPTLTTATNTTAAVTRELSGVMVVIIIAGGVLLSIVLFIFAKRQIMRFTIRSRRGPHAPVGHDAKKSIKREIERRLDCIPRIVHEPQLIWDDDSRYIVRPEAPLPPFYWRLKAVDDVKILEREIGKQDGGAARQPRDSIRAFLLTTLAAAMNNGTGQRLIHQFCDMYEHARHDPSVFGRDEYEAYRRLLLKLLDAAKMLMSFGASRKSSPSRTPLKKQLTKNQSLLDPARLRPPSLVSPGTGAELLSGSNNRLNITLGLQQQQHQQQAQHRRQADGDLTNSADEENEILSISFTGTGDTSIV